MSLLPYLLSEIQNMSLAERRAHRPCYYRHQDADDLLNGWMPYRHRAAPLVHYLDAAPTVVVRRRQPVRRAGSSAAFPRCGKGDACCTAVTQDDGKGVLINIDVQQFQPEELSVQVLRDERCVVIEGKHEERQDEHGYVMRQFTRRYMLPDDVDVDSVVSRLASDGVLQVLAPKKEALPPKENGVRHVPITHSHEPAATSQEGASIAQESAKDDVTEKEGKAEEKETEK